MRSPASRAASTTWWEMYASTHLNAGRTRTPYTHRPPQRIIQTRGCGLGRKGAKGVDWHFECGALNAPCLAETSWPL